MSRDKGYGFQSSFYAYKTYLAKRRNMIDMMKVSSKMGDVIKRPFV